MSIHNRIANGEFRPKTEYVSHRIDPEKNKAYRQEEIDCHKRFKQALFEEHGVENNPKRELCFSKAWEKGHAYGMDEVANVFDDLVELIY